ncbi:transcription termination factor MTERF15, mitochondrial-like [Lycium barbarum]|uniref:transcription termination factor MTERF15, mitochondrial-like n=1 Tax=Lycium barbarum TaxID=112863 RepID=UPI00293E2244|nr:transcription termination factor MTERF15, mitochondrial-like [Lycium barbarum]XP_060198761.1 transcription termination factor MTERF15, mitochondrial-like [Lycium barbarum]
MAARLFKPNNHGTLGQLFFIYNSKFLFQYSTKTTPDPTRFLVNYLVKSLGFSRKEAISTNTKVFRSKSTGNPQVVLNFFEQNGLDKTHIGKIVSLVPKLLLCDVDKTLKPKLDILKDLGLSGTDLVKVVTGSVSILGSPEISDMRFSVSYLREVLGSDEYVVKAIKKKPCLLFVKSCERLRINMLFFKSLGFSDENIKKFLVQNPYTLLASPESVEEKVERLRSEFNISRGSGMFIHGVDVFISMKESTIDTKLGVFRDYGWSKWDITKLVQLLPYCLRLSQKRLRASLNFYMEELGLEPAYLASHPTLLMFSMKKRVLPRLELMKSLVEKKLYDEDYNLYTVLLPSEQKFHQVYVLPYKDKVPDVCELYNKIQQHGKAKK